MLNSKIRGGWDKVMSPVGRALGRLRSAPTSITLLGVAVQGVVAVLIIDGRLVAAGLIAIVAALFDTFDGAVAKAQGRVTKFGAFLDSTTDRLSDALYFVPVAWLYGVSPGHRRRRRTVGRGGRSGGARGLLPRVLRQSAGRGPRVRLRRRHRRNGPSV